MDKKAHAKFDKGVFHVFHVNRSVNIFLMNRKFFYVTNYVNRSINMEHMKNAKESLALEK